MCYRSKLTAKKINKTKNAIRRLPRLLPDTGIKFEATPLEKVF